MIEYFQSLEIYSWQIISLLIVGGFCVGFLNVFAGSASVITFFIFESLIGMPTKVALGTLRINVILNTLVASLSFFKKRVLNIKQALKLALPTVIGGIPGAFLAVNLEEWILKLVVIILMIILLSLIFLKPTQWIKGKAVNQSKKSKITQFILFLLVGFYGGFFHIGIGIFLLSTLVLSTGLDIVKANATKVLIVFLYLPAHTLVYYFNGQMDIMLGLIPAIGSIPGAYIATTFSISWGPKVVKWILTVVMILFIYKLCSDVYFALC